MFQLWKVFLGHDTSLVLAVHFGDVTSIRETKIGVVANDQVLMDRDSHDSAGVNQLAGNEPVFT